jgi:HK97 family phage portal protein
MSWIDRVIKPFVRTKTQSVNAVVQHDGGSPAIQKRDITGRGWELLKLLSGGINKSGVTATQSSVLGLPAAFSCIRQISETVAMLPIHLHEKVNSSERRYINDHPALPLLNKRGNAITNSFDLRRDLVAYALIFPSAYLWIQRDGLSARPIALWLKKPGDVTEYLSSDERTRHYRVNGVEGPVMESDLIRLTNCFGKSVVHLLNEAFGTSIATQSFAAQYFANNGNVVRYATTPNGTKDKTQRQNLESDLSERFGPNSSDMPLLEYGIEVKELTGVNLSNAQALETRKWQAEDVCRIFNMPPSKIGLETNARYNSVEMTEMEFLRRTILPWITVIEQELNEKLLTEREKATYYFQHKTAALVKADIKTRLDSYDKMSRLGWTINEIRELEDYDPIEGGDVAFIQVNQIPLNKAQDYADKLISKGDMPGADNNLK